MASVYKGATLFIAKRNEVVTERGQTIKLTLGGTYVALRFARPNFGDGIVTVGGLLTGYGSGFCVETAELDKPGRGQEGSLIVTATDRLTFNGYTADPKLKLEKEWLPVEVALLKHPNFQSGGIWALDAIDYEDLARWEREADPAARADDYSDLTADAKQYADRLLRAQTAYNVYLPVAKRTRFYTKSPDIGGCGHPESPPGEFAMPAYDGNSQPYHYLKTADRSTKTGFVHERGEEWIGFIEYDAEIINNA